MSTKKYGLSPLILVVEAVQELRDSTKELLTADGYRITTVKTSKRLWKRLDASAPT